MSSTDTMNRADVKGPKKTRNLAETRRAILNAAFEEIYANGFHASSIDAILARTELTKGALFHQFASKLELGYAVAKGLRDRSVVPGFVSSMRTYLATLSP